jgi:hypothetical protein
MKAYLGIRDSARPYDGGAGKIFGIDRAEKNFARVRIA